MPKEKKPTYVTPQALDSRISQLRGQRNLVRDKIEEAQLARQRAEAAIAEGTGMINGIEHRIAELLELKQGLDTSKKGTPQEAVPTEDKKEG